MLHVLIQLLHLKHDTSIVIVLGNIKHQLVHCLLALDHLIPGQGLDHGHLESNVGISYSKTVPRSLGAKLSGSSSDGL